MSKKVSILSSAGQISGARLHRLANVLIRNGYQVHIWAPGSPQDAPVGATFHKTIDENSKWTRVLRDLSLPFQAQGEIIFTLSPDLIPLTFLISKIKGKKYIADLNEDYLKLLRDRAWAKGLIGKVAKLIAWSANQVAAKADLLIVADVQVPPFKAKNRLVVRNFPDPKMIPASGELESSPRAIYIGDLRKSRGLQSMLRIAELTPKWNFDFIGKLSDADQPYVDSWLKNSTAAPRVKFHGRLEPNKSWQFAKGAWVGLSLLESTPAFIEAVPSKLYEYAYAGLAVISTPLPRCIEIIKQSGGGVIIENENRAAEIMNMWAENPTALLEMRKSAVKWAREVLNSEAHYAAYFQAVDQL